MPTFSKKQLVSVLFALTILVVPAVSWGQTAYTVYYPNGVRATSGVARPVQVVNPAQPVVVQPGSVPVVAPTQTTVVPIQPIPTVAPFPFVTQVTSALKNGLSSLSSKIVPVPTLPPLGPWPTLPPYLDPTYNPQPTPAPVVNNYVALGDSIAKGLYASKSYPDYYQAYLTQTGTPVVERNLGQLGWKSGDLLQALRTDQNLRQQVQAARVVTWNIGGNDLRQARDQYRNRTCGGVDNQDCLRQITGQLKMNWSGIVTEVKALRGNDTATIKTMDIYNPYVIADQQSDSWAQDNGRNDWQVLQPYVADVNAYISANSAGIPVAPVYNAFNGSNGADDPVNKGYIVFDGFHPNDRGHQIIAQLLTNGNFPPVQPVPGPVLPPVATPYPTTYPVANPTPYPVVLQPTPFPPFYRTPTPTPNLIPISGTQCPAGTHMVTQACTQSYPNPSCYTYCAPNTTITSPVTAKTVNFLEQLNQSLSRDL